MINKIVSLFILTAIVSGFTLGNPAKHYVAHKPKIVMQEESNTAKAFMQVGPRLKSPRQATPFDLSWVFIDSMQNWFGTGSSHLTPLSYDPWSNSLGVIHRGHASIDPDGQGHSGVMWYNTSTDEGATWTRCSAALNGDIPHYGRYPSGTISNPSHSTDPSGNIFEYSYPQLNPSAFGYLGYGLDPFSACTPFAVEFQGTDYVYPCPMWTSEDANPYIYFTVWKQTAAGENEIGFWQTTNQGETWSETHVFGASDFATLSSRGGHGRSFGSSLYIECAAKPDTNPGPLQFALFKSNDNGSTWSSAEWVNWHSISALADYDDIGSLDGEVADELAIDNNGNEHIFFTVVDTNVTPNTLKMVEVYRDGANWGSNIIGDRTLSLVTGVGTLQQMDNELHCSWNKEHTEFVLTWIDAPNNGDTYGDIFAKGWKNGSWYPTVNVTNTPTEREMNTHLAQYNKLNGDGSARIYLMKTEALVAVNEDSIDNTLFAGIWSAGYDYPFASGVTERENGVPAKFALYRNYPNPFNPTTKIAFDIAKASSVTLKIYDITGKELETLYNGYREAGKYEATFDASKYASGVYIYKLQSDNFSASEKMILTK